MYGGLNLKYGLSLRPYGSGSSSGPDPDFASVTVLYGFEDANFAAGVHNDGSLGSGTVTANGVAPNTTFFVAGKQSAAFNQNGAASNDGILMGATTDVIGSGDFTIEGFIRDPATANFLLFSCGTTDDSSNRLNISFDSTRNIDLAFNNATEPTSPTGVWPADSFFHFAFVYETTPAWRCYVNGTQVFSGANSFGRNGNAYLGQHILTFQPQNGPQYLDELRITKVARYTGTSFPVPSVPFPRN